MHLDEQRTLRRASGTLLPAALAGLLVAGVAGAAAPNYHLTRLESPGAQGIYVNDINDAGEMVGYYIDETFVERAFLWDADGPHDLAVPVSTLGNDVFSAAAAINNAGQIVGYANVWDETAPGLLWTSDDPGHYELLSPDPLVALTPSDISDNGTAVGLKAGFQTGEAFHGFVWTAKTGVVDYGTPDTANPEINASWIAVNDSGDLVGVWNFQFAPMHASVGVVGTPAMLPLSAASDAVASTASAINAGGQRIGYMDMDGSGDQVPVMFAADGSASAIPGATLGLPAGQALGINHAGTIVGRANDFATLSFKAFVAIDGESYDLFEQVDDSGGFDYLLAARAVNASGQIVGVARYGDLQVGSYLLTPANDTIFSDGFEP
jgi:uncharacterized membrane protein